MQRKVELMVSVSPEGIFYRTVRSRACFEYDCRMPNFVFSRADVSKSKGRESPGGCAMLLRDLDLASAFSACILDPLIHSFWASHQLQDNEQRRAA